MAIITGLILFLFSIALFVAHILCCLWAYRDCKRRGKSSEYALLVLLAILFFPLAGLIVYMVIRND
ncbi:PLDc N-terminal domain-containing protein [Paenibacillus hamazuiensis]|uniref:PLDc N-terminal domain-containing protein n=1 Tax=Paenibacillus hamazuiensis TaxID=2936508 RepID=UPI00200E368C|nr:PLDc N-terminal domain-containing protein [Paenibacillus hamazuiensis]